MASMRFFANFEKHKTLSALETSITLKVCAVLYINNAMLHLLVYAKVTLTCSRLYP